MSLYYDRDGIPTDVGGFMAAFESNRRVGLTSITGGNPLQVLEVSTVFLGIDHSHGSGPPLLFETMVFGLPGGDEFCVRYSTEREAQEGHTAAVVEMAATMTRAVVLDLDPNEATTVGAPLTEIDTSDRVPDRPAPRPRPPVRDRRQHRIRHGTAGLRRGQARGDLLAARPGRRS